jgi:hypothetical protein
MNEISFLLQNTVGLPNRMTACFSIESCNKHWLIEELQIKNKPTPEGC